MNSLSAPTLRRIVLVLFLVMIGIDAYQTWRIAFVRHEADFPAYLAGAHGILNGTNPYAPTGVVPYNTLENYRPFIYPLFVAWLWIPFTFLIPLIASFLWFSLSVAILINVLRLLATLFDIHDERLHLLFYSSLTILFVSIIQADLMFGQMNLFVLYLLLIGAEYLEKNPIVSGFGFGAAISVKFMPVVLLPVIMLRNIRISIMAVFAILILAIGVPFLIAGTKIFDYYQYWFTSTIAGEITQGNHGYASFDLASVLAQLAGMAYPTTIMRTICGLVLLSFPLLLIRKGSTLAAFCMAFMLLPLTASRSEPAHLIILMPAVGLLLAGMIKNGAKLWMWFGLLALQLMILWGFNKAIPIDTVGMLVLFGIVFRMGIQAKGPEIA
jgi:Glycosyltransferase family 87